MKRFFVSAILISPVFSFAVSPSALQTITCVSEEHVASFRIAEAQLENAQGDEKNSVARMKNGGTAHFSLKTKDGRVLIETRVKKKNKSAIDIFLLRDSKLSLVWLESDAGEIMLGYQPLFKSSGIGFFSGKLSVDDTATCVSEANPERLGSRLGALSPKL